MRFISSSIAVLILASLAACGPSGQQSQKSPAGKDWPGHDGDWGNTRYSTLSELTPANMKNVGAAWKTELKGGISRSAPVVQDGLMFIAAGGAAMSAGMTAGSVEGGGVGGLYALDAKTGAQVWQYVPDGKGVSNLAKGAGVGDGKVYVGLSDAHVAAVDQKTGKLVWNGRAGADPLPPGEFIAAAPVYAEGMVLVGIGSGDAGISGRVVALDSKTGNRIWEFHTIAAPGEPGHETWPADTDAWKRGGAGVWANVAVDPDLGFVIFGSGNAFPQYGGEVRAGDNLYSASVIALDLKTGKYRWHYQFTHHEIWEADVGAPVVLYTADVGGKQVPAVAAMRMDGYVFMLDRATGKPIIPVEERPVKQNERMHTSPTQPYPVNADKVGPACVEEGAVPAAFVRGCFWNPVDYTDSNVMLPGSATRFAPMSYDPATKQFYVTGGVSAGWARRAEDPYFFGYGGSVPGVKSHGLLVAFDAATDKIAWQKETPRSIATGSGVASTAGGLLFHGEPNGNLQAYDAKAGDVVWEFQTGAPVAGPVAIYEADGHEHVAVVSGQNVWSFALNGTVQPLPAPPSPPTVSNFTGRIVPTDQISMGVEGENRGVVADAKFTDDFALQPTRVKVAVGTKVTWTNNGTMTHDATAEDGSWTTGPIAPGKTGTVTFSKPGTYTYICKEHPWTYGQIVVE